MTPELRELYQEVIIDHGRHPRNFGSFSTHTCSASGHNPLCGDKVTLYLNIHEQKILNVSFEGEGCAISMASASLLTEALKGESIETAKQLFSSFQSMVTSADGSPQTQDDSELLGKLTILSGVQEYPMRVKCATLIWHVLNNALQNDSKQTAKTE